MSCNVETEYIQSWTAPPTACMSLIVWDNMKNLTGWNMLVTKIGFQAVFKTDTEASLKKKANSKSSQHAVWGSMI